ncbi:MAG: Lrp/AsnC ligand binding domain-containing protein [Thermoproteota archaeon]|nr:Lrp/AsnC ligand binding domain-containing protein [Thermoproteota archaeon]MDQ4066551.1 Lrp/AsnC ligand binding domain-containing protein [Thermoproteota archaeon]
MISAFVLINCHFPFDVRIKNDISNIPSVTEIYRTSGRYDLLVKISADAEDNLKEIVSKDIGTIHGIDDTVELIIA